MKVPRDRELIQAIQARLETPRQRTRPWVSASVGVRRAHQPSLGKRPKPQAEDRDIKTLTTPGSTGRHPRSPRVRHLPRPIWAFFRHMEGGFRKDSWASLPRRWSPAKLVLPKDSTKLWI